MKHLSGVAILVALSCNLFAQSSPHSLGKLDSLYNFHFQLTSVIQHKNAIHAPYTGLNSLTPEKENAMTLTSTIFLGIKLWKGAAFYINPELAGGSGISSAHGIAGFTNGEAFRVGDPAPTLYVARGFVHQTINFGDEVEYVGEEANSIYRTKSKRYLDIVAGKFSIADYFDLNSYSHDPRSQFFNWSLMSNGAWDYPANVRGYTWGLALMYVTPSFSLRGSTVMVPETANGNIMDSNFSQANSSVVEVELNGKLGTIRFLGFYTNAHMGNYRQSIEANPTAPDITATRKYGRTKYGYGVNYEKDLGSGIGIFARASWNDGTNETWAFTEIDRSVSGGVSISGSNWKRESDVLGIGTVVNGLSQDHHEYLGAGGYGFMIGDGQINYGNEWTTELYYKANLFSEHFFISPNIAYVVNPAYNKDRGPAFIAAIRAHVEF